MGPAVDSLPSSARRLSHEHTSLIGEIIYTLEFGKGDSSWRCDAFSSAG